MLCSIQVFAEHEATIIFPDGEKKTYILSEKQLLVDLKVDWECSYTYKQAKDRKDITVMTLVCNKKKDYNSSFLLNASCVTLDNGNKITFGINVMVGSGKKNTDITIICH